MTVTVLQLISAALKEIGAIGASAPIEAEQSADGLELLQGMHDTFSADRLMLFAAARALYTLTAGQATRTIGSGGNFSADRPMWVSHMGVIPVGDTTETEVVPYRDRKEYDQEPSKALTAAYPFRYIYEPEFPLGKFTFWPVPTTAAQVAITTPTALTSPLTLLTSLAFPPGTYEVWKLNLALRACRTFRRPEPPMLREDAERVLGQLRRVNDPGPPPATFDPALTSGRGFDIRAGHRR